VLQWLREWWAEGDISLRVEGGSPALDTDFNFGHRGKCPSEPLDVRRFRHFGHIDGLGERLIFKVSGKKRVDLARIKDGRGVEPLLGDLQLGSASIEVGHSECVWFMLVVIVRVTARGGVSRLQLLIYYNHLGRSSMVFERTP
jgi:hypothetical protein